MITSLWRRSTGGSIRRYLSAQNGVKRVYMFPGQVQYCCPVADGRCSKAYSQGSQFVGMAKRLVSESTVVDIRKRMRIHLLLGITLITRQPR